MFQIVPWKRGRQGGLPWALLSAVPCGQQVKSQRGGPSWEAQDSEGTTGSQPAGLGQRSRDLIAHFTNGKTKTQKGRDLPRVIQVGPSQAAWLQQTT